jgi:FAD-dependent urate hydroxylase
MKIAILGGGVAGVSSAIALKQKGFDVSIYERHESSSNIGAGIVVWPNAAYVLEQLGVLNEIEAVSGHPTRMRRLSSTNEELGAIDIEKINSHMGYSSLSILRSDFQNILISKLESLGVAIQYAHTVTNIETKNPGQAEVHFQNGSKITADVLIGADGRMASYARRYVHGDNAPVYQGFINWIGVYESEEESFEEIAVADYWGVGERFGIVPVTKHKGYWAGGIACADIGPRNQAEYKAELGKLCKSHRIIPLCVER